MPGPTVRLEDDGRGRVRVMDGGFNGLGADIPLVAIACVIDPREVHSLKEGVSIGRETEGWFGPKEDVNPGPIRCLVYSITSDGGGALAPTPILAAPGAMRRYRVLQAGVYAYNGGASVASGASLDILSGAESIYHTDGTPAYNSVSGGQMVNVPCPENTAITVQGATLTATFLYTFFVSYRIEDAPA